MNLMQSARLLLPVAILCGCASTNSTSHNYQLYGDTAKGEFLVDTPTGAVWQYQQTPDGTPGFVRIPVVLRMEQIDTAFDALRQSDVKPVLYVSGGTTFEVLLSEEKDFLKIHPDAKKVTTTPLHKIKIGDKYYVYKGHGPTDQLENYTEIPPPQNALPEPTTATNAAGNRIISHDGGKTWTDIKTGKPVGQISVTAPNGVTYTFPDQEHADKFKKEAGIR